MGWRQKATEDTEIQGPAACLQAWLQEPRRRLAAGQARATAQAGAANRPAVAAEVGPYRTLQRDFADDLHRVVLCLICRDGSSVSCLGDWARSTQQATAPVTLVAGRPIRRACGSSSCALPERRFDDSGGLENAALMNGTDCDDGMPRRGVVGWGKERITIAGLLTTRSCGCPEAPALGGRVAKIRVT